MENLLNRGRCGLWRAESVCDGIIFKKEYTKKQKPSIRIMYTPPFSISTESINMIAEISGLIERYAIRQEQEDGLRLRKANRIRTIHSSLAIEGNKLSEDEVRDIIEGKNVVAPLREIQEVKNAIKTYEMYPTLDPFKEKDMLHAHAQMMEAIMDNAGRYRTGGVGVFSENGLVHMAPPAERVPVLMGDLFDWLKRSKDHLLVRSCVFHYEFEFIHPFADGNGRMGRLWQSLILGKLHPLFEHLPIENMVYANQQAYYDAIAVSTKTGNSGSFIDFMLHEILETLKTHQGEEKVPNKLKAEFCPDGFNVGVNIGRAAGQSVMHVHLHVIPRYWGDMVDPKGGVRGVIPDRMRY